MTGFAMNGADAIRARLAEVQQRAIDAGERGLDLAGRNTLNVSNGQVPHEEGDLERDGAVVKTGVGERAITYGRRPDRAIVAIVQHEDMGLHHDDGRNAKFLENALNSQRETNLQILGGQLKQGMGT